MPHPGERTDMHGEDGTDAAPPRPLPQPSSLTAPFWEAAARRELVRPVCDACGRSFFTPQLCCPSCHSEAWTYRPSAGLGTVYSHTVVHRPPSPAFDAPYVLADVEVDEGWNLLTAIVDCPPEAVGIGMRVAVAWQPVGGGIVLPAFAPAQAGAPGTPGTEEESHP